MIKPQVQPVVLAFDDHATEPKHGNHDSRNEKNGEISAAPQYPSPIEGVPERLGGALAPGIQNVAKQARSPSLPGWQRGSITPVGGLAEMRQQYVPAVVGVHQQTSPVEGLVAKEGPYRSNADFGMQTGPSIDGSAEKPAGMSNPHLADVDYDDDDNYGFMDGGDWGGYDDDGDVQDVPLGEAAMQYNYDGNSLPPVKKPRRPILNPGIRLRNQLPRKSLAIDPMVGRQEVAPGIRRSTRQPREPLRWWLGEKKEFDRIAHKTLPTVREFTTTDPNTPWKTVADPKDWKNQREQLKLRYQDHSKQLAAAASKSARSKGKTAKSKQQQGKRSTARAQSEKNVQETRGKGRGKGKRKTGRPLKEVAGGECNPALPVDQVDLAEEIIDASCEEEADKMVAVQRTDEFNGEFNDEEIIIANANITTRRSGRSFFVPEDDGTPEERSMNEESLNEWGSEEETEPLGTRPDSIPPDSDARAPSSEVTLRRRDAPSDNLSPSVIFNMAASSGGRGRLSPEEGGHQIGQGELGATSSPHGKEIERVSDVPQQTEEQHNQQPSPL